MSPAHYCPHLVVTKSLQFSFSRRTCVTLLAPHSYWHLVQLHSPRPFLNSPPPLHWLSNPESPLLYFHEHRIHCREGSISNMQISAGGPTLEVPSTISEWEAHNPFKGQGASSADLFPTCLLHSSHSLWPCLTQVHNAVPSAQNSFCPSALADL